jgi:hypothetical protein
MVLRHSYFSEVICYIYIKKTLECSNLLLCVIRKMLTTQRAEDVEEDDSLRMNIFHT